MLAITDGVKTITYTSGQRNQDTYSSERTRQTLKRKRKAGLEEYETKVLNQHCKRSCTFDNFGQYCNRRKEKEDAFIKLYSHPVFRQFKFTNHCKIKSSESKAANRIIKTFSPSTDVTKRCMDPVMVNNSRKAVGSSKELVIAWGNWGKRPNCLKGQQSTPGIGLRKSMEKWFTTETINEDLTSQRCPCCHNNRSLKKMIINDIERHHLLRCTNDKCQSRLWNRNVVGSFNILYKGLHPEVTFRDENLENTNPVDESNRIEEPSH